MDRLHVNAVHSTGNKQVKTSVWIPSSVGCPPSTVLTSAAERSFVILGLVNGQKNPDEL
jgi:hypothetical protein